jgi:hypothetical protein
MIIANPIYDSVFKYLLEDIEISKGLLSAILNENIIQLSVQPQETVSEITANSTPMTIYRLDFKAIVQTKEGYQKKVLIELQKTRRSADVMRFRRYLAENYQKEDAVMIDNEQVMRPLEIVTIYLLGFKLDNIITPILKVNNCYFDVSKQENLKDKPREPFVDLLNHESYTIQIPRLPEDHQTDLENVLSVFSQRYNTTDDRQQLDFVNEKSNPLTQKIVDRLNRAIADRDLRIKMNLEDEIERTYGREMNELVQKLIDKDTQLADKENQLADKDTQLADKENQLTDKDNELEKLRKELERMKMEK